MDKVFGLGFSKTGTTSLEGVFEILGYNVCKGHWNLKQNDYLLALYVNKDYKELQKMTTYWDAFADGPWGGGELYKELYKWYPNAKYILTYRDPEQWYNSLSKMLLKFGGDESNALTIFHNEKRYGTSHFFRHIFNINELEGNKEKIISYYKKTNEEIEVFFKGKSNFLKINLTEGGDNERWISLCTFLERPVPNVEFPHSNKGEHTGKKKISIKRKIKNKIIALVNKI